MDDYENEDEDKDKDLGENDNKEIDDMAVDAYDEEDD